MNFPRRIARAVGVLLLVAVSGPASGQASDTTGVALAPDTLIHAATGIETRIDALGTAVGRFDAGALNPAPIFDMADLLAGRTAGLVVQDVSGNVGTSQRLRIRGASSLTLSSEPLIFVDGMRLNTGLGGFGIGGQEPSRLNDLNPQDVAGVQVVKGPAGLALYGSDAAGGVILITTKRGADAPTAWEFFAESGTLEDVADYPANYAALQVLIPDRPVVFESGQINTTATDYCPNLRAARRLCTQDRLLRFNTLTDPRTTPFSRGSRTRYGVSVRGGDQDVRYFLSGALEDETGVYSMNGQETVRLRANLDATLTERADMAASFAYTDRDQVRMRNDNSIFSPIVNGLTGYPNFVERSNISGEFDVDPLNYGFGGFFPYAQPVRQDVDRFLASSRFRWRPVEWLTLRAGGGLDFAARHDSETVRPFPCAACETAGSRASRRARSTHYTGSLSGTATFMPAGPLRSTSTVGVQWDEQIGRDTECFGSNPIPGTESCEATSTRGFGFLAVDEDFFQERSLGLFLQQQFALDDRVFLSGGLRAEKASTFGRAVGFHYFPSAQLSWVVSEESFFPDPDFLSRLRVRGGWGRTGRRPDFRQAWNLYVAEPVALPDGDATGYVLSEIGNAGLGPEITSGYELGFEAGLFDDRLALDFTWFDRETREALLQGAAFAPSLGLSRCTRVGFDFSDASSCSTGTRLDNLGRLGTRGTELGILADVLQTDRVGIRLGFMNTTVSNEVLALGPGADPVVFNRGLQRHAVGYPAGGFWQEEISWADENGDGFIGCTELFTGDPADGCEVQVADEASYIGPALPTWQRSVFADLRLFHWITVSTLFEGRGGHFTGNDSEAFRCGFSARRGCRAVGDPTAPLQEQAAYIADRYLGSAAGYVEKADFWRWRELSIALEMPDAVGDRVRALDGLRLTLAGRNLATFTGYDGLDPEINETGSDTGFHQSEFNTQPPLRYLLVRLDYRF